MYLDRCLVSPIKNGCYRVFNINFLYLFISQSRLIHPHINIIGTLYDRELSFLGILQIIHLYNYNGSCLLGNENKKKPKLVWCTEIDHHRIWHQNHSDRDRATVNTVHTINITNTVIVILNVWVCKCVSILWIMMSYYIFYVDMYGCERVYVT